MLSRTERLSEDAMRAHQERQLRRVVRWAARRTPYYRHWFRSSAIEPGDIRGLEDLSRLPILERADLVGDAARRFLAYPVGLAWAVHSSGTTGEPATCYRSAGSSVFQLAAIQRQWSWFGVGNRPRMVVVRGMPGGDGAPVRRNPGANQLLVSSFALTPDRAEDILAAIADFEPEALEGWPSSLSILAGLADDAGRRIPVRAVFTASEMITSAQRALIGRVCSAPVVDHYGQMEAICLMGECERGGYHVWSDCAIVELLPAPGGGGRREVVHTPLHNLAFPIIRYRSGDVVTPAPPGARCPCGRESWPLIGAVVGRSEEVLMAADGGPVPLASILLDHLPGVRESQLVQTRPGAFEARVVAGSGFVRADAERAFARSVDHYVGSGQDATLVVVERIPRRASGKLSPVVVLHDRRVGDPSVAGSDGTGEAEYRSN
jgi:phenylacetate-CoA ligase